MFHECSEGKRSTHMTLCPALDQLRQEHVPLLAQMQELQRLANACKAAPLTVDDARLHVLQERVDQFIHELNPHSEREEGVLFPMMARYIGREVGPIAVMEFEHSQAKMNLRRFQEEGFPEYLLDAIDILVQHFMKEEQVLFPMAQQMLTEEEKWELWQQIKAIR